MNPNRSIIVLKWKHSSEPAWVFRTPYATNRRAESAVADLVALLDLLQPDWQATFSMDIYPASAFSGQA